MSENNESRSVERTLIYIPIVHTESDMGNLGQSVRQAAIRKLGLTGWKRKVNLIDKIWTTIEKTVDDLNLPYEKVLLYQDGLPVCGREIEIVTELAGSGSRNHQLLLRLMERGARAIGTESPELLMEEYEFARQSVASGKGPEPMGIKVRSPIGVEDRRKALSDSLLKRRDRFIADRINSTLSDGETGIIFLGMLHCVEDLFDKDIRVLYPVNLPPRARNVNL